ncbi:MAG: hydrogenase maturation protease [Candidatus Marinimicrobia bacterium]|nr:hydrogenase maturation protease [Candidatus Neomarinimicrobiota bacterium]
MKAKIFAVGNSLYGDDGIGKAVLDKLQSDNHFPEAEFYDADTDALSLIDRFSMEGLNIIIDAAKMGENPGKICKFTPENVALKIHWDNLSLHGFGLAETFEMAKKINMMPKNVIIIGIEPEKIEIGNGLSEIVEKAIPKVIQIVEKEITNERKTNDSHH